MSEDVAELQATLEWLGQMIGDADWWASPQARECVPCDGCRAEAQEMAAALAPWRARWLAAQGAPHA
jgi:hypothetical protein